MGGNAHIREIGGDTSGQRVAISSGASPGQIQGQRVISNGPCNTPQQRQQQPQDGRRSWSDLFDWGHHNGVRISQAGDSHGS